MPNLLHIFMTEWLDLLWIPVALAIVHKGQRLKSVFFVITCVACLRLQIGIMASTGYNFGFTGWFEMSSFRRGMIVYAIFIAIFLLLSHLSPYTKGPIYLAACLSIFFMAFIISSLLMIV